MNVERIEVGKNSLLKTHQKLALKTENCASTVETLLIKTQISLLPVAIMIYDLLNVYCVEILVFQAPNP